MVKTRQRVKGASEYRKPKKNYVSAEAKRKGNRSCTLEAYVKSGQNPQQERIKLNFSKYFTIDG
jgi:hypothetical protein